ncbi:hypothetical protein CAPTEDRAFT_170810 [Capitella teleta]|uniref:Programmed cell death protein 4 n=1 Tax=Capitella teleta TaxID=283909 RepID=R7UMM0_CAPTE|nr:hypothetical protein CAPTEDRAFT_170810 [Capitella teleta]|eukprot:ELU07784.1 hypothetical protein CAPTEDRAFT_170810 [Capitella teleta]
MEAPSSRQQQQDGGLNGNNVVEMAESPIPPVKSDRVFKKAKNLVRMGSRTEEDGEAEMTTLPVTGFNLISIKKNRKSRGKSGRGLPKKGGAGGKGVWGKPGSELYETSECQDDHDPNYDSDNQGEFVVDKVVPILSHEDLNQAVDPILREYLEHCDTSEVAALLRDLNIGPNKYKIPLLAISLGLDRHDPQREFISRLLSDLYGAYLTSDEMQRGFHYLLKNLKELTLDMPSAPEVVGQFIARAIADDCLPPAFINHYRGHASNDHVIAALDKSDVLLNMKQGMAHLDNIWGEGGGNRPVKSLTNQMVQLLKEYLNSGDISEATRCLQALEVPHFHHELVYHAALIAIEDSGERATDMMVKLLRSLTSSIVVTLNQFEKGIRRLSDDMPDICLDVPSAYSLLDRLASKLQVEGVLTDDLMKELPNKGRKRFVSEGDGGKLKERPALQSNGH